MIKCHHSNKKGKINQQWDQNSQVSNKEKYQLKTMAN